MYNFKHRFLHEYEYYNQFYFNYHNFNFTKKLYKFVKIGLKEIIKKGLKRY